MFKFRGKYDVSWAPLTEWSYWKCLYVFAKWLIFQGDTFWWEICPCRWTLVQDVVMTDLRDYCVSIHLDCARKALEEKPTSHIVRVMRWDKHKPQAATERTSRPVRRQKKATQCKQTACLVSDTKRECVCVCVYCWNRVRPRSLIVLCPECLHQSDPLLRHASGWPQGNKKQMLGKQTSPDPKPLSPSCLSSNRAVKRLSGTDPHSSTLSP